MAFGAPLVAKGVLDLVGNLILAKAKFSALPVVSFIRQVNRLDLVRDPFVVDSSSTFGGCIVMSSLLACVHNVVYALCCLDEVSAFEVVCAFCDASLNGSLVEGLLLCTSLVAWSVVKVLQRNGKVH